MSNPAQFHCKTRGCVNVAGIDHHGHQHDYCGVRSRLYWMEQKLNDILGILVNNVNGGPATSTRSMPNSTKPNVHRWTNSMLEGNLPVRERRPSARCLNGKPPR